MNLRAIFLSMAVWLTLLGLAARWVTSPIAHPPAQFLPAITVEETSRAFLIRLAPLPNTDSSVSGYARKLAADEPETNVPPPKFDYEDWAQREVRKRLMVGFFAWIVGGLFIHWLMAQVFRDERSPSKT